MVHRIISPSKSQSFFLFGARGTGKSTWIRENFPAESTHVVDLLHAGTESRFAQNPDLFEQEVLALPAQIRTVVIDEVQKLPKLLDLVHRLIERPGFDKRFVLTGSSARKLKSGGANLLAGRASQRHLYSLTSVELGSAFDLQQALSTGTLPKVYFLPDESEKEDTLRSYADLYLKEEVWNEHLVRKLDPFRKFLNVAAQSSGKIINYSKIAKQVGVDTKTVQNYYQILEETWLGFILEPYQGNLRSRVYENPKFYFSDLGVCRALNQMLTVPVRPQTSVYGDLFEQWVILEFLRMNSYRRRDYRFTYFRTHQDHEIDLVIERPGTSIALVEIKSSTLIQEEDLDRTLLALKEFPEGDVYCLSQDPTPKQIGRVRCVPWQQGLSELGLG